LLARNEQRGELSGKNFERAGSRAVSPHWIKVKNPNAPAVKREAEEDWGR
jgi:hypothetical protein